jgi:hypothetical protein
LFVPITGYKPMSTEFNRGIMKFKGADTPITIILSAVLILGFIAGLIWWALQSAYVIS